MLPSDLYNHAGLWEEAVRKAREWMKQAELILIIGTNGYYGSVYWNYRKRNAEIIQINPARTGFDRAADLNIRRDADSVFEELMKGWD